MLSIPSRTKMFLCMNPVDMRKSFDGLFGIVQQEFQQDPLNGHLFLFINKRRDRMKAIFWDNDEGIARKRIGLRERLSWAVIVSGLPHLIRVPLSHIGGDAV